MKLQVGAWDSVPAILQILLENFPETKTSYAKLKSSYEERSESNYILLTPEGFFDPFASFVLIEPHLENDILFETLNPDWEAFSAAIAECPAICWSSGVVGPIQGRLTPLFEDLCRRVGNQCRDRCQHCEEYFAYHISEQAARSLKVQLCDGVSLCTLTEDSAEIVNELWPYGGTNESLQLLKNQLRKLKSVGLTENISGALLAFVIHFDYGAPGALHVMKEHRRKGYGEIILTEITLRMIKSGCWPKAFILLNNVPSQALFEKLGYVRSGIERWHYFEKKKQLINKK